MSFFKNPVSETTKPDPFILQVEGNYYCYSTHEDGVNVSVSNDLIHFEDKGFAYTKKNERDFWAPSAIYLNGIYYLYYSSVLRDHDNLDETLKVASSTSPFGPFKFERELFSYFSIDSHPYFYRGELYLFYSTNLMGTTDEMPGTSILLDKMKTPFEVEGLPKVVVFPSIDEEIYEVNRFNDGRDWYTIEGASVLERNGKLYIIYSANAYTNENYFMNYSVGDLKDDLRDIEFTKYPNDYTFNALVQKNRYVSGTGHNTVCKGPDLIEDFIIYHGRNNDIPLDFDIEQRTMRVDRLFFEGNQLTCDGPKLNNIDIPRLPLIHETNIKLFNNKKLIETGGNYLFDLWIKGEHSHSGIRYGFTIGKMYQFELIQGLDKIQVYKLNGRIRIKIQDIELYSGYNHEVSHLFRVTKIYNTVSLILENGKIFRFDSLDSDDIEIFSLYSTIEIIDFKLNNYNCLEGDDLIYMSNVFQVSRDLQIQDKKIDIKRETILIPKKRGKNMLTVEPLSEKATFSINGDSLKVVGNREIYFDYNETSDFRIICNNIRIIKFRYAKNCNN